MKLPLFAMLLFIHLLATAGIFYSTPYEYRPLAFGLVTGAHAIFGIAYAIYTTLKLRKLRRQYEAELARMRRVSDELAGDVTANLRKAKLLSNSVMRRQGGYVTGEFAAILFGLGLISLGVTVANEQRQPPVWQTLLGLWVGSALVCVAALTALYLMCKEVVGYL